MGAGGDSQGQATRCFAQGCHCVQYVWATWQLDCMATCCQAFEFLLPDNRNGTGNGNMFTGNRATFGNIFNGNKKRNIEEICPIKNVAMK